MRGRKRKPKYLEKPKKSNANQIDDKNKKPGSFVMYYDFETDLWYKCRILEEVGDLLQLSFCGWGDLYELPYCTRDSDSIESMEKVKGKWKCADPSHGGWRRQIPHNHPESLKKAREAEAAANSDDS